MLSLLEMQAAEHTVAAFALVVLDKLYRSYLGIKVALGEGPTVLESLVILKGSRLVLLTPVDLNESL